MAMAATPALSCPFDLQKEWLADAGTCDDLCPPEGRRKVCNPVKRLKPREFETASGKLKVDQSLVLSNTINDMELEPALMGKGCPRAVSISKAVVHRKRSYLWLNGYLPIMFRASDGFATP